MVAMSDPTNVRAVDDISIMTGLDVRPGGRIRRGHRRRRSPTRASSTRRSPRRSRRTRRRPTTPAPVTEIRESAGEAPVIKLVNGVIAKGVEEGASDIHFEPEGKEMRVRYRVDGVLHDATTVPRRMVPGVVSRLKIMGEPRHRREAHSTGRPRRPDGRRAPDRPPDGIAALRQGREDGAADPRQGAGADRPRHARDAGRHAGPVPRPGSRRPTAPPSSPVRRGRGRRRASTRRST